VFLVAVPVMALLLLLGPRLLPEYRDPSAGRIDPISVAQSLAAVLGVIYALKQFAEHGFAWGAAALLLAGLTAGALFVRRQGRLVFPLLDLELFRQARFSAAITAYGLSCLAMFGVYIFITQYLQLVLDLTPLQAGVATVPWALAFVAGSLVAPRLARRRAPVAILVWGMVAAAAGFAGLALVDGRFALPVLVASTVVMSLGLGPVFTIGNEMIITAAPPERAGAASAISETASELSGALGIAVLGSLGMMLYRHALGASLPEGVPGGAAADAMATLGGAVAAASSLPGPAGDALRAAARAAFVDALQFTAVAGAAIVLLAAAVAARILRGAGRAATVGT
jgi:DHA2 family multidrug resistance protein-like MFS transporter